MQRLLPARLLILPALLATLACTLATSVTSAEKKARNDFPWYVERATWAETMLASRAAYLQWQRSDQPSGDGKLQPFVSEPIAGDGSGQAVSVNIRGSRWLRLVTVLEQGGGNCHIWGDARLIASDGSTTWLSDLKPSSVIVGWGDLLTDRNWQDHPLKIGERQFEHGVWVHANSDVCYRLNGKYERFEAWAGMDADRAIGQARFKVLFTGPEVLPEIWKRIAAAFPVQSRWFREDAGRRELEWFGNAAVTTTDHAMISRVLSQLPAGGDALRKQFEELRRQQVASEDPRWLNLYERACRFRESGGAVQQIWIAELQSALTHEFEPLLDTHTEPEPEAWQALAARASAISQQVGRGYTMEIASLAPSMETLTRAIPDRWTGGAALIDRLKQR
ncbi:MAG: NPCBM/NEW2 domain-containing protein, partial [Planctomycetes bacterium]|nr:NPCBM/NEW2 domain-containing protein [Planctomycetota bacterium]